MKWRLLPIGRPKLEFARAGMEEYLRRLRGAVTVEPVADSAAQLRRSEHCLRVVLDERGEQIGSRELAARASQWEHDRVKTVAVLIGGADGHSQAVREAADWLWSLGRLTLQHELSLVVLLEQIYRLDAIRSGSPYHRD